MHLLLDSGPLGLVTHPRGGSEAVDCVNWLASMLAAGVVVYVPEIVDYELRRELLRSRFKGGSHVGLTRLDALVSGKTYLPLTTAVMRRAAQFWAQARNKGAAAASDESLDADMILCAQALELEATLRKSTVIIATTNPKHLTLFCDARLWRSITVP